MNFDPEDLALTAAHEGAAVGLDGATADMVNYIRETRLIVLDEVLLTDHVTDMLQNSFDRYPLPEGYLAAIGGLARALVLMSRTDMFQE